MAFAEIEKFIDTPVKHYSTGMYLRLAFAVAAHLETEILLVDEVLAVGDARVPEEVPGADGRGQPRRAHRGICFPQYGGGGKLLSCHHAPAPADFAGMGPPLR